MYTSNKLQESAQKAAAYYNEGYYCSEAVLLTTLEMVNSTLPREVIKLATGFGGGLTSGCICGALSGAIMALGLTAGRTSPHCDWQFSERLSKEMHELFINKHRTTCCRVLLNRIGGIDSPQRPAHCANITADCAAWVMDLFEKNK